jgi:hypothetical protein
MGSSFSAAGDQLHQALFRPAKNVTASRKLFLYGPLAYLPQALNKRRMLPTPPRLGSLFFVMAASPPAYQSCARCGHFLPREFTGNTCPACLPLAAKPSKTVEQTLNRLATGLQQNGFIRE